MRARIRGWGKWVAAAGLASLTAVSGPMTAAQMTQTDQVMRQKLTQSERLLAALVTANWAALDRHGRALQDLTTKPGWDVMRLPEFHNYATAFQRSAGSVVEAAGRRDQREALAAYNGLVASCVECHRYVARSRIARAR
jgi:hypothetical protein